MTSWVQIIGHQPNGSTHGVSGKQTGLQLDLREKLLCAYYFIFITLLLIGPMELLLLLFPFKYVSKGLLHNYATTTPALLTNACVCTHACMLEGMRERDL